MLSIPVASDSADYRQDVTLEEQLYILEFRFNSRSAQWSLNFLRPDETAILLGVKLVLNLDLLASYRHMPDVPQGELFCIDSTGKETEVTRDNLGAPIQLIYVTKAERGAI